MNTGAVKYAFNFHTPAARIIGVRPNAARRWTVETTIKGIDCVYSHLTMIAHEYPSLDRLRAETLKIGVRSPRPFVLGAARDVSVRRCAIALTHDFLLHRNVDPRALIECAYVHGDLPFSYENVLVVLQHAEWEGIRYPEWTAENVKELIDTLRACEVDQFARLIEQHVL